MKNLKTFLFSIIVLCMFSCSATKHTTTIYSHDTVNVQVHDTLQLSSKDTLTIRIHDTVIVTPQLVTSDTFTTDELTVTKTASGQKIAHQFSKTNGNLKSSVTVDTSGFIIFQCKEDSLKIVIKNLQETINNLHDSITNHNNNVAYQEKETKTVEKLIHTKIPGWVKWIIGIILLIVAFEILLNIFFRKSKS